ncbi:MAG: DegT/DnrJ/EryC1/StrS family aminotransferase [Planctomycetota bacterium]|nr:DegT/DnrJ/EryC1/StrS family aminotransferase [Planctomycetota bacterium]
MELAIFGAAPMFAKPQPVGFPLVEPDTERRFHRLVDEVFRRNYLTNDGPLVRLLEEEVASRHGCAHAVFMANATLAQLILMKALGLESGSAVVGANTFVSTAHVCEWSGLTPVFADLEPETLNLDPREIVRLAGPDAKAVIPTHVFGVMADLPEIIRLARERGLQVVVDAAHAFDCDRAGVRAGGFGVPEFISFHATKFFSTFEGGAVLTDDDALARAMRDLRNFGFAGEDDVRSLGINAKGSEISAAFGIASLPALAERRERLRGIYGRYNRELAGIPGLRTHRLDRHGGNNHRYYAVFVDPGFGASRDAVVEALRRENVLARRYFYPGCHRMRHYRGRDRYRGVRLPATDKALGSIIALPTWFNGIDWRDGVSGVSRLLKTIHERGAEVERHYRGKAD